MRYLLAILFALLASAAPAVVASATYDVTACPQIDITGGIALTSTQTTITLNRGNIPYGRVVQLVCDQPWGISTATGAYAAKQPLAAATPYTLTMTADSLVLYVQAASTSGTIKTSVLGGTAQ